jgi:hypothetical protein
MHGMLATHMAFGHCYPLIYYLTERVLFKKYPHRKILKKAPGPGDQVIYMSFFLFLSQCNIRFRTSLSCKMDQIIYMRFCAISLTLSVIRDYAMSFHVK